MEIESQPDLFVHDLRDIYNAEKQILKALPKMIKAATNEELGEALEEHRLVTEEQVARLDTIFGSLKESSRTRKKCKGMEGLLEEGSELLEEDAEEEALDAGIIAAAQKVEHYEIAAYGTLVAYANLLGDRKAAKLLEQTLDEEKEADQKLTQIAEASVNTEASYPSEDEEEEGVLKTTRASRGVRYMKE